MNERLERSTYPRAQNRFNLGNERRNGRPWCTNDDSISGLRLRNPPITQHWRSVQSTREFSFVTPRNFQPLNSMSWISFESPSVLSSVAPTRHCLTWIKHKREKRSVQHQKSLAVICRKGNGIFKLSRRARWSSRENIFAKFATSHPARIRKYCRVW